MAYTGLLVSGGVCSLPVFGNCVGGSVELCLDLSCGKAASVVRVCVKVRLSDMVFLQRPALYDVTWVHDENQVEMLVRCWESGNGVEVDTSAGLAC